jgi:hypothetical protein
MSCVFVWDSVDGDSIWKNSFVLFGCEVLVPLIERGYEKGIAGNYGEAYWLSAVWSRAMSKMGTHAPSAVPCQNAKTS